MWVVTAFQSLAPAGERVGGGGHDDSYRTPEPLNPTFLPPGEGVKGSAL